MALAEVRGSRSVVLASADVALRQRLRTSLTGMRWQVHEANGGAEAMAQLERENPEALLMDHWLPDLEAGEFATQISAMYPGVDVLRVDGDVVEGSGRSPRRHELLHALREALDTVPVKTDTAAWNAAPATVPVAFRAAAKAEVFDWERPGDRLPETSMAAAPPDLAMAIPGMVGTSAGMMDLARLIRLVAPRTATVLIEGETGAGKEIVAKAVHQLSTRAAKPFAVLNCAAIPEALLEAELFGHTRGAFTGAVTSRTGRIEAAHGGTLFLDEIGEMPLALQAKMLRFLECGELQRVGDNDVVRVDVRVIAATHQHLEERAAAGTFRLDLYHRLAVFPVEVPALRSRLEDVPALVEHFLALMGRDAPRKRISAEAIARLHEYSWPGNVRELAHVLERAVILCGDAAEIRVEDVRVKRASRS